MDWTSSAQHKLLSFNESVFVQVLVERVPVNVVSFEAMEDVRFIYNVHLLSCFTFHNYLPYAIRLSVSRIEVSSSRPKTPLLLKAHGFFV